MGCQHVRQADSRVFARLARLDRGSTALYACLKRQRMADDLARTIKAGSKDRGRHLADALDAAHRNSREMGETVLKPKSRLLG